MAKSFARSTLVFVLVISILINHSQQLQSSTLLRFREILNFPEALSGWNISTNFCNTDPNPSLTIVCYEGNVTQLHVVGKNSSFPLPKNFSIQSFVATLVSLPSLKVLTLSSLGLWGIFPGEISRLTALEILNLSSNFIHGPIPNEISNLSSLQTLILDDNLFTGSIPAWIGSLSILSVLSFKNNSFYGSLPISMTNLATLRILVLSHNRFSHELPDLTTLTNLQVLDLENNQFGTKFPKLGRKLVTLVLKKNNFFSVVPVVIASYYQIQRMDLSYNKFIGPFPASLLSLPAISYLSIAGNRFTGMLFNNLSCNSGLEFADLSSNLLTGFLPDCLVSYSKDRVVLYSGNCLGGNTNDMKQHPVSFCRNEALAVGIVARRHKKMKLGSKVILGLAIVGGIFGTIGLLVLGLLAVKKARANHIMKSTPTRFIAETTTTGFTSKLLSDARYISQTMKMGAIGMPSYRIFSREELEEATNNFDSSAFMDEGSHGQMWRAQLKDGSTVAVRCVKIKKTHGIQNCMHYIELIAKLRHRHLVGALGSCFEYCLDDSSLIQIFFVFEYVPNRTLRAMISDESGRQWLSWAQCIACAIGVAKGIQFLHTGIVPGVFSNNLKITDILLDHNLVAKISSYNLPLLTDNIGKIIPQISSSGFKDHSMNARGGNEDKADVYDFGVILLEIIVGRPCNSENDVDVLKNQLQACILGDDQSPRFTIDLTVQMGCSDESLKTMTEICVRCLLENPADRPSVDDVLWNLQFAAQVQESRRGESPGI